MAEPQGDGGSIDSRRRGAGKRSAGSSHDATATEIGPITIPNPPCGACKFLRRKCIDGCIFAPYFASDQGAARFAAVHKVFGASNVSKLLSHIPVNHRHDAIVTICYEAQARLSDPVYGCVSTVLALQQQVASLQTELATVHSQLMTSRLAVANALQSSQQQPPDHLIGAMLQPAFSNASASSNNLLNMNSFNSGLNLSGEAAAAAASHGFEPLHLSRPSHDHDHDDDEDEDDEEESRNSLLFANQILQSR